MIVIAKPAKPFSLTAKQTLRRQAILLDYADEIAAAYKNMQDASFDHVDVAPPSSLDPENSLQFVRSVVKHVVSTPERHIGDDEDMFMRGIDR